MTSSRACSGERFLRTSPEGRARAHTAARRRFPRPTRHRPHRDPGPCAPGHDQAAAEAMARRLLGRGAEEREPYRGRAPRGRSRPAESGPGPCLPCREPWRPPRLHEAAGRPVGPDLRVSSPASLAHPMAGSRGEPRTSGSRPPRGCARCAPRRLPPLTQTPAP